MTNEQEILVLQEMDRHKQALATIAANNKVAENSEEKEVSDFIMAIKEMNNKKEN